MVWTQIKKGVAKAIDWVVDIYTKFKDKIVADGKIVIPELDSVEKISIEKIRLTIEQKVEILQQEIQ